MPCRFLDPGSIPNRESFARFWRDRISYFADLLPKANGTSNGEEGTYPDFPYQANYIKGLRRLDINFGDDVEPTAYCDYLGILREARLRVSNRFEKIALQDDENKPTDLDCNNILPPSIKGIPPPRKQTNPQGGLPVSLAGPDPSGVNLNLFRNITRSLRAAPRIDGLAPGGGITLAHENTAEMVELYWMALLRDLPFHRWTLPTSEERRFLNPPNDEDRNWQKLETDGATIDAAVADLNRVRQYFAEAYPVGGGEVTTKNIFRGATYGDEFGPYISQFLLRGNTVRCARGTKISNSPRDGVILEGSIRNLQKQTTVEGYVDFLRQKKEWRCVEQGFVDPSGTDPLECGDMRFIRNLRDLGNWVHLDDPAQHFRNAALLMLNEPALQTDSEGENNQKGAVPGRTALDSFPFGIENQDGAVDDPCRPSGKPFPFDICNPYVPGKNPINNRDNDDANTQTGFVTFGPANVLDAIGEVTNLALRAAWWQKWYVHRRLRPEEFGGLVDGWLGEQRPYQIDILLRDEFKPVLDLIKTRNGFKDVAFNGEDGDVPGEKTYLLPQIFPEGSPTHPSYPSGHATIAGACATLLKSFFNTECPMTSPTAPEEPDPTQLPPAFVASSDGTQLIKAAENDTSLTVGGELDKLASNISIGRNAAGVHWRSDATQGMELGEAVTAYFLYELAWSLNEESFCFTFRRFFQPEQITIIRETEYNSGQMIRRVKWKIQTLNKSGQSVDDGQEVLSRTGIEDCP